MTRDELRALCRLIETEAPGISFSPATSTDGVALGRATDEALLRLAVRLTGDDPDALRVSLALG